MVGGKNRFKEVIDYVSGPPSNEKWQVLCRIEL